MDEAWHVVAVPGTLCAPLVFDRYAALLAAAVPGVRVTATSWMQQPGPWDLATVGRRIADEIRAGAPGPVALVGHSTGGAIALWLALAEPQLVDALVLVDTGANMHDHGDVDAILRTVREAYGEELRAAILDRSFAVPPGPDVRADLLTYARAVSADAVHDVLSSQREHDFAPRLADLACPVAVVHGTHDPVRTVAQARDLAARIPGAELTLVECGHTPPYEAPEELVEVTRRLMARQH